MKQPVDFKALLKQNNLRVTNHRLCVLQVLHDIGKPAPVDQIILGLEHINSHPDQATVYRIIDSLTGEQILQEVDFGDGKKRYEIAGDHHHHLVCEKCGHIDAIKDCLPEGFEEKVRTTHRFNITHHNLEFFGLCNRCR
jgi:Fur family ferric uptake transcriptional regulator